MSFYPEKVQKRFDSPQNAEPIDDANAEGKSASFVCGSFVAFDLNIVSGTKTVASAAFRTNGCGFMIAAADVLADAVTGKNLADLHGLDKNELIERIATKLDGFPLERSHCVVTCIEALRSAFSVYRTRQIDEFQGETALICTCFGVSEATIVSHVSGRSLTTVAEVTAVCNAGAGCGSCRMLIQEMIDARNEVV